MIRRLRRDSHAFALAALLVSPAAVHAADASGLQKGIDALNAGKTQLALKLLSDEIEAPGRKPADRARALYFRSKAHLAANHPAHAISDANAALYTKQLPAGEAADAEAICAKAMKAVGLTPAKPVATAPPSAVAAPVAAASAPAVAAPPTVPRQASTTPAAPPPIAQPAAAPPAEAPGWSVSVDTTTPRRSAKPSLRTTAIEATSTSAPAEPAPRAPAAAWSAERITREELPAAAPTPTSATAAAPVPPIRAVSEASAVASPPAGVRAITTGSISSSDAPAQPEPQGSAAAPSTIGSAVSSAGASVAKAVSDAGEGVAGLLPSVIDGIGGIAAPGPARTASEIEAANAQQKTRAERIKAHNDAVAAGKPQGDATAPR